MRLLLDSCVLLWVGFDWTQIPAPVKVAIEDADACFYSPLSLVELSIKNQKEPTLPLAINEFADFLEAEENILELPFDRKSAVVLDSLPYFHKDPFDRMLVSQASAHGLTVVTSDRIISQYDVPVLW